MGTLNSMRRCLLLVLIAFLTESCTMGYKQAATSQTYSPVPSDRVEILSFPPNRPFKSRIPVSLSLIIKSTNSSVFILNIAHPVHYYNRVLQRYVSSQQLR